MSRVDPVRLGVIWGGLVSIAEEMGAVLRRTAYSEGVREGRDFSTAFFDASGRMVAQGNFSPGHLGSMPFAVRNSLTDYPKETLRPGDAILMNDLYMGSGHLPDFFLTTPVFCRDKLVGFAVNCAHHVDVGGLAAGSQAVAVADFHAEGIRVLPVKAWSQGEPNREVFKIISGNVRVPEKVLGDLKAQRNANRVCEIRFQEFVDIHGLDTVRTCMDAILDESEKAMRAAIDEIPDGTYVAEDYFDDYAEGSEPVKIRVAATIAGSNITYDFTGSSDQTPSGLNSLLNYTRAYSFFATKCVTVQDQVPQNEGCIRPIRIIAPEGSLFNPRPPAAGGARAIMQQRIVDTILLALSQAIPEKVCANSSHWANPLYGGLDPRTGRRFVYYEIMIGGTGARPHKDGAEGLCTSFNLENIPVEVNERNYPVLVEQLGFVRDSGGPGKYRGGTALRKDVKMLGKEVTFSNLTERQRFYPRGLFGGTGTARGFTILNPATENRRLHSKGLYHLKEGDVIAGQTSGSGGYGNPWERDPRAVLEDVLDDFVSLEGARRDYGVVIDPMTMSVDEAETTRLRTAMAKSGGQSHSRAHTT